MYSQPRIKVEYLKYRVCKRRGGRPTRCLVVAGSNRGEGGGVHWVGGVLNVAMNSPVFWFDKFDIYN